ncbi:MAG: ral nucleoside transport system permease protein [Thermomicrobiales bacterium]|jgi:simple sugar transport system permease protein|nr:ral nucleoside transport system permease protein [Thermomicrobiales bacterium]
MTPRGRIVSAASLTPFVSSLLAIGLAFLVGGIFLEARGKDALLAYRILFERGLGDADGLTETFKQMAPLLIISGGLLISLRAGVWNIGLDGQFMVGALMAGVVGAALVGDVSRWLMLLAGAVVGFAGGLVWATVPALLRVRWGLNEIITTLMMNYVGLNLTSWLVKGPARDKARVAPETVKIPIADRLPAIPGTEVHVGLIAGLVVVVLVAVLFRSTVLGYMLNVLGRNPRAAIHAGLPVGRLTALALLLSGGFAGLAGASDVLGVQGFFKANWDPGYGFTGFALVYLARLNPVWLVPFAFFFSFLLIGGESMPRRADVPTYYVEMLEGLMLIFFAAAVYLEGLYAPGARRTARDESEPIVSPSGLVGETPTSVLSPGHPQGPSVVPSGDPS